MDSDLSEKDLDLPVDSDADGVGCCRWGEMNRETQRFHCPIETQNREDVAKANLCINRSYKRHFFV